MAAHAVRAEGYRPFCESARDGWKFGRGITKHFDPATIECSECRDIIVNEGTPTRNLLAEIKADMRRRNPDIERDEWEVESYR